MLTIFHTLIGLFTLLLVEIIMREIMSSEEFVSQEEKGTKTSVTDQNNLY